jgi:hypothetical protein
MKTNVSSVKGVKIGSCAIFDSEGRPIRALDADRYYVIAITIEATSPAKHISVGYNVKLGNGITVYGTSTAIQGHTFDFDAGESKVCRFSFLPKLALGTYFLSVGVAEVLTPEDEVQNYVMQDFVHDAFPFVVGSEQTSGLAKIDSTLVSFKKF